MQSNDLNKYVSKLLKLKQGTTVYGKAPHKPIFMLSLIFCFENKFILENKIYITTELVGIYRDLFANLAKSEFNPDFALPFYHLSGDGFWCVIKKDGLRLDAVIRNFNILKLSVNYAVLDESLYQLFAEKESREILKRVILDKYFPNAKLNLKYNAITGYEFTEKIKSYILNDKNSTYNFENIDDDEEIFVRGGLFKKIIPQIYNYTCCITKMRLISNYGYSLVDACHIVPFSQSNDDKITNGITLCPNLHRAFDRGIISISERYEVLVSDSFNEDVLNDYSLVKLRGRKIVLPIDSNYCPDPDKLKWHRENILK